MPLPCRGWTLSRMKTQSAIRDAPGSSRTLGMGNFQLDAPHYGPFRFSWICLPLLVSSFFSRGGGMHLFFIKKKSFPQQLRAMTHSVNSHTCSCLDPGRRTCNFLRTCFLSSLHRGRQPPNQGQPEVFVFLPTSRAKARESSS